MKYIANIAYIGIFCFLFLFACKEEDVHFATFDPPHWEVDMNGYVDAPHWTVEETGDFGTPDWKIDLSAKDKSPEWNMIDDGTDQYSMTAIIRLSDFMERYEDESDCLAAFIGNECRGVAVAKRVEEHKLYFLYIKGNNGEPPVSLKYYSAKNNRIYELRNVYEFFQNASYGTVSAPETVEFESNTPYAESMSVVVALPQKLVETATDGDMLAAFCGTECRGVAKKVSTNDGNVIYALEVRGTNVSGEKFNLRYYSEKNRLVYKTVDHIRFEKDAVSGTSDTPILVEFLPESSMKAVVVVPVELQSEVSEADEVAAFVDDECIAAGTQLVMPNGRTAYELIIRKTANQPDDISFKYYNAKYGFLYESGPVLKFKSDSEFGTLDDPEVLPISMSGKYPFKMKAYVVLPEHLAAYADNSDELAAFVNDDCRGVGVLKTNSLGETLYEISVIGEEEMQEVFIRYYSGRNSYLYQSAESFMFKPASEYGVENAPIVLNLYNVQ